jgi:hypothetical protein
MKDKFKFKESSNFAKFELLLVELNFSTKKKITFNNR